MEAMRSNFRPEFLNRIDEIIIFHSLKRTTATDCSVSIRTFDRTVGDRKMSLKLTDTAVSFLADVGFDPVYGARPLKRAIQRELETQIAKGILRGEFNDGDTIFVDVENERLTFKRLASDLLVQSDL